jgi:energy-coupling factor transport system ATP-binding protein
MTIKTENVSYIYQEGTAMASVALNGVSTEIGDGQFIGLIGHTGSGKSTFVQLLNGLLKPTSGRVLCDDVDIFSDGYNRRALRARAGLVFQYPEHQLFEETVLKDVCFGPKNMGMSADEQASCAREALDSVGIEESCYQKSPFELSGGQKRRAAIAGVLAMHPELLILDEPTAGLDPRGRDEIYDLISKMHSERDMTILLVSHSMDDVARYMDRIIVMNEGNIAFDGVPKEVFSHYKELESMGLAAPQIMYIMNYLKESGLPVKTDMLTVEEAAAEIIAHRSEIPVYAKIERQ